MSLLCSSIQTSRNFASSDIRLCVHLHVYTYLYASNLYVTVAIKFVQNDLLKGESERNRSELIKELKSLER